MAISTLKIDFCHSGSLQLLFPIILKIFYIKTLKEVSKWKVELKNIIYLNLATQITAFFVFKLEFQITANSESQITTFNLNQAFISRHLRRCL